MANYRIISSDNHINETPDLWTSRIEPKFKDRCPQLVTVEGEGQIWVCDNRRGTAPPRGHRWA